MDWCHLAAQLLPCNPGETPTNRNSFNILTASTLIAIGAAAGVTTALAGSSQGDEAEVQALHAAKDAITAAEQNADGKLMSAELDNEDTALGVYDVEVAMADGTTKTVAVNPADGAATAKRMETKGEQVATGEDND